MNQLTSQALLMLLICSFTLFLHLDLITHLHAKPLNHNPPLDDDSFENDNGSYSPTDSSSSSYADDTIANNNVDNSNNHQLQRQLTNYAGANTPSIVVHFLPPLVQASVFENATTNLVVPIAQIRANITINLINKSSSSLYDSSNQNDRSQSRTITIPAINSSSFTTHTNQQPQVNFQIEFSLLNHLDSFAISKQSGEIFLKQGPLSNYTYILDVRVAITLPPSTQQQLMKSSNSVANLLIPQQQFSTKVPIILDVIDLNNNEPESAKNLLSCVAFDNIDTITPICTAPFKDGDRGINAELSYSILSDDDSEGKTNNLRMDPKTGSIFRRSANVPFLAQEFSEISVATDHGQPYLETSIKTKFKILESNITIKRGYNEKPYFLDSAKFRSQITLTGTEESGDSVANLTPYDPDGDLMAMHIVGGDPNAIFTIDDGVLILAKNIDFSERKIFNLTLMLTDGAEKSYLNMNVMVPKIIRKIPNRIFSTNISMSNSTVAKQKSELIDLSRFAYDTSYVKFKLYSATSYEALTKFEIDEYNGIVSLAKTIDYRFNGRHGLIFSIEDNRLSSDHYRSFVELNINVNLIVPPPPPTTTTSTTTTTTTTTTSTTTTTTTTTPRPTPPSTTTTTTTTTTPRPTTTTTTTTTPKPTTTSTTTTTTTTTPAPPPPPPPIYHQTSPPPMFNQPPPPPPIYHQPSPPPIYHQPSPPPTYLQPSNPPNFYQPPPPPPYYPAPPFIHFTTSTTTQVPYIPTTINTLYDTIPPASDGNDQVYPSIPPNLKPPPQLPTIGDRIPLKTLLYGVMGLIASIFFAACMCLLCRCCCRDSRSKRYRDKNGTLLNRSSFHSQQRLHSHHSHGHHGQSSNVNGSMARNMNSRLSLRTTGHANPSSARGLQSKYGAGDSVSLSAMNERTKQKPLLLPPSPVGTQNSLPGYEEDEGLYANAFGPGHPQYLNELRRLKPDFSRMSARLPANRRQQTSTSTVNSLVNKSNNNRNQSKSSSALPSTPIRTSSHSVNPNKNKITNHRPLPSRNRADLNGSRTTNTSANVSPSLNDNNSRTVLLGSDDIRTPIHKRQRSTQIHTDSTADYDEVASHSTVDDTTPHMSSETTSVSEVPSESRFKTFVKQKKNKGLAKQANHCNNRRNCPASEDTDNEPSTSLLHGVETDDFGLPPKSNGSMQNDNYHQANGNLNQQTSKELASVRIDANEGEDEDDDDDDDDSSAEGEEEGKEDEDDDEEDEEDDEEDDDAEEGVYEVNVQQETTANR